MCLLENPLSANGESRHAHFIGIGGVGMAGLAWLLKQSGWTVSGCDLTFSPYSKHLERCGISVEYTHSAKHIRTLNPERDVIIKTAAVPDTMPEIAEAVKLGLRVVRRGEALARVSGRFRTIAVCGAHGKTTTACLIASVMRDLFPDRTAWCIGGATRKLGFVAGGILANNGFLVVEADESDGSLACYAPFITVITNIDSDHVDFFKTSDALDGVFREIVSKTSRAVIFNLTDKRSSDVVKSTLFMNGCRKAPVSPVPIPKQTRLHAEDVIFDNLKINFKAVSSDSNAAYLSVNTPGMHNVANCLLAMTACMEAGESVKLDECARALQESAQMPRRRFEQIPVPLNRFTLICDYAHHPREIKAFVSVVAQQLIGRKIAVFQPHRYSRTKAFLKDFAESFPGVDTIVIVPVFPASEQPAAGGMSSDLYSQFRDLRPEKSPHTVLLQSLNDAVRFLEFELRPGDTVMLIGAGDIVDIAGDVSRIVPDAAPPYVQTRLGAYGTLAHVRRITSDLDEFLSSPLPRAVIGGGANTIISPTGFSGTIFRPGAAYSYLKKGSDPCKLTVGCAMPGASLLSYCLENNLSGLEFMAGIPGCCGGWLAMNAGTRYGSFCDVVDCVHAVDMYSGERLVLSRSGLNAAYRSCPGIKGRIALEIDITLHYASRPEIESKIEEAKKRRFNFSGLRTAGSVFKNPPEAPAGKLLEEAGCKNIHVGGAWVCPEHANVICTDSSAEASDVIALVEKMKAAVSSRFGIELQLELNVL